MRPILPERPSYPPVRRDGLPRPLIYIAGPIGEDETQWDQRLMDALLLADTLLALGGALPFVSHLAIAWQRCTGPKPYETWMALDEGVLERCDAMVRMPGHSPGSDQETAFARGRGIPVLTSWAEVTDFLRVYRERANTLDLEGGDEE